MSSSPLAAATAGRGHALLEGLPPVGLAYLLARESLERPLLVVCAEEERAERLTADLRAFGLDDVLMFPGEPHVPFDDVSPDPRGVFRRLGIRHRIAIGERPAVIVAAASAVQGRWLPDAAFSAATDLWVEGEEVARERLAERFVLCGYQPVDLVEDEGTFALRGGIVDVFPPDRELPFRLDLFGDEIASIKTFDPETQRTLDRHEALVIYPIREVIFDDEGVRRAQATLETIAEANDVPTRRLHAMQEEIGRRNYFYGVEALWPAFYHGGAPVLDTLLGGEPIVVLDEPESIADVLTKRWERCEQERNRAIERHRPVLDVEMHLEAPDAVSTRLRDAATITSVTLATAGDQTPVTVRLFDWQTLAREMATRREDSTRGEILDPLVDELRRRFDKRHEVFLTCSSRGNAERLRELLRAREIDLPLLESFPDPKTLGVPRRSPRAAIAVAALSSGLSDAGDGVAILTDVEIFGTEARPRRRRRRRPPAEGLATLRDLTDGALVIHIDHGIGRYLGLRRLILGGVDGDYVHLEYAGGDRLYVPVYRLNLLQRFRGPEAGVRLDKLGGYRWAKVKQRVKDAVLGLAHELLAVQAQRRSRAGFAVPEPDDHFRAFEATFPFEETPDQQRAIDEVLADLTKDT
ncbi:MAG: CarD family transcriptional regulator, partial [Myxococcota bacterium]